MWIHNINPILLKLGPLEIRYYGLIYVLGFFLALAWLFYLRKRDKIQLAKDELLDFTFYALLGVLVGSRLFMVFWEPGIYLKHPLELLKIWQGGMSFHGGLVGIIAASWLYCRKKKLNFWRMADILALPAMLALALGRVANFINGELVGRVWPGSWCVVFPQYDEQCRHPSILYAAAYRLIIFGELLWLSLQKGILNFKEGFIFWNFIFLEGTGRFIVDFWREDVLYLGLSLGQWFSLVMILAALIVFIKFYKEDWKGLFKKPIA